jgi:hypothetical protein
MQPRTAIDAGALSPRIGAIGIDGGAQRPSLMPCCGIYTYSQGCRVRDKAGDTFLSIYAVATTTDGLPELFRLRLCKPRVLIPMNLGFPVGRVIRGARHWTPPEDIRELSGHGNPRYGSGAVLAM